MDESKNIHILRELGTKYMKESLFKPKVEKPEIHYNKNHLQIARRLDGSVYTIDLSEACRILLLGATRSGKTWFMRGIGDRLYQTGRDVIYLLDVKNEFWTSRSPVQSKFVHDLLPGEEPIGLPIVTLRPTFFKTISPRLAKNNFWYSIDMNELTKADFMTLMNVDELTQTQRIAMDLIFDELTKKLKKEKFSLELVEKIIEALEITTIQKNSLRFKFRPLKESKFIENDNERSIVALLTNPRRYVPAINMENFDSFGKGAFQFPEVVLNVALREAILARRTNPPMIKPLWVFMDESSRFIGNRKTGSLKQNVLESVDLDTRYNVNYVFATQVIEDIPDNILKQCKYIFIPATADVNTIKTVLVQTAMVKNQQVAPNRAMKLKQKMKKVPYSWIILNRMAGTMDLVKPLPPLSFHLETTN